MSKKKYDIILHWGELNSWLGANWKSNFSHDTVDITLPRGKEMRYASYEDAIKTQWGDRPINNIIKTRGYSGFG